MYAIVESNDIDSFTLEYFVNGDANLKKSMSILMDELRDAKEYGSILNVTMVDFPALYARMSEIEEDISMHRESALNTIRPLVQVAEVLAQKYSVTCTNPPYMGNGNLDAKLSTYIKKKYKDGRNDLFAVFIARCMSFCQKNGLQAMITQHQWMFLSSYEQIRQSVNAHMLVNMAHLGARAFDEISGEVVQTAAFIICNKMLPQYLAKFIRLVDASGEAPKMQMFLSGKNRFVSSSASFKDLPGSPLVYWIGEKMKALFRNPNADSTISLREGIHTGQNDLFLRAWNEIEFNKVVLDAASEEDVDKKGVWVPYNKGGTYRKWYGNNDLVIGFDKKHRDGMARLSGHVRPSQSLYFKEGGTWSALASGKFGLRYYPKGFLFDSKGQVAVGEKALEIITLFNLKAYQILADMLMPTLDYKCGDVKKLPYCHIESTEFLDTGKKCVEISKTEYDSYETSWDFQRHPMLNRGKLADAYTAWKADCESRFLQLKANEEELNRIFIDIYGLQEELTPDVEDKDVTVHRVFDTKDDVLESMKGSSYVRTMRDEVVSLISYAVGCMFGRYSLDTDGLAYAGGEWDISQYQTFMPDKDNIIPICDDDYFDDDITGRFIKWVETVYGADTLEENLKFIANALGGKGSAREVIRNYFISDFYADHLKTYQKRPIYWLFDSGKKGGFKALVYMHRYQPDTIARIRTDYVHEQQSRYRTAIADLQQRMGGASTGDRVKLTKQLTKLEAQAEEIRTYEEKIHHLADQMIPIDLDDGVKVNYAKFADVLAKIK